MNPAHARDQLKPVGEPTSPSVSRPAGNPPIAHPVPSLAERLQRDLQAAHGPVLGGSDLARALGYRSMAAFRQARRRAQVKVTLFTLPHRRGVFALASDVAIWLAQAHQELTWMPVPSQEIDTQD